MDKLIKFHHIKTRPLHMQTEHPIKRNSIQVVKPCCLTSSTVKQHKVQSIKDETYTIKVYNERANISTKFLDDSL